MQKNNEKNYGKNSEKKRKGLVDVLSEGIGLPSDALFGEIRIEMRGRDTLFVSGCRRILKYCTNEIKLAVKGFCIDVMGCDLICTTYHYGTVTVEGCICSISFEDGV